MAGWIDQVIGPSGYNQPVDPSLAFLAMLKQATTPDNNKSVGDIKTPDPIMVQLEQRQKMNDILKQEMEMQATQAQSQPSQPVVTPETITKDLNKDGIIDHGPDVSNFFNSLVRGGAGLAGDVLGGLGTVVKPYDTTPSAYGPVETPSPWMMMLRALAAGEAPGVSKVLEADVANKASYSKALQELMMKNSIPELTEFVTPTGESVYKTSTGYKSKSGQPVDMGKVKKIGSTDPNEAIDKRFELQQKLEEYRQGKIDERQMKQIQNQYNLWQKKNDIWSLDKTFKDETYRQIDNTSQFKGYTDQLDAMGKAKEIIAGNMPFDAQILITTLGRAAGEKGNMSDKDAARYVPSGIAASVARSYNKLLGSKGKISKEERAQLDPLIKAMETAILKNRSRFISGKIDLLSKKGLDHKELQNVYGEYVLDERPIAVDAKGNRAYINPDGSYEEIKK